MEKYICWTIQQNSNKETSNSTVQFNQIIYIALRQPEIARQNNP